MAQGCPPSAKALGFGSTALALGAQTLVYRSKYDAMHHGHIPMQMREF